MTAGPWLVPITTLKRSLGARREERRSARVGELRVAGSVVPVEAEAAADAVLVSVDGGIEVTAVITAPWRGECRRCLKPIAGELRCDVREVYRPRTRGEAEDPDEDTYPLHGEQLDLQPLVRDALILELPMAPLCRPDCRGLCPTCGADLNDGPCDCPPSGGDPRWAILDVLRPPAGGAGPASSA
jgi:uncharacterized protein